MWTRGVAAPLDKSEGGEEAAEKKPWFLTKMTRWLGGGAGWRAGSGE